MGRCSGKFSGVLVYSVKKVGRCYQSGGNNNNSNSKKQFSDWILFFHLTECYNQNGVDVYTDNITVSKYFMYLSFQCTIS